MATKQKTAIPQDPDDLICDTCPERFGFRGTLAKTDERARVGGWHIYRGYAYQRVEDTVRTFITRILCPNCIGTNRTKIPAPRVLEGQADILADLGVQVSEEEKPAPSKRKRREAS